MEADDAVEYLLLMEEIKARRLIFDDALQEMPEELPDDASSVQVMRNQFVARSRLDVMALQLRKITELIALGSLAAHKELFEEHARRFQKHWHPGKIIKDLERVNPDFYPKPMILKADPKKPENLPIEDRPDGFLTKDELVELHGRCGSILHADNPYGRDKELGGFYDAAPGWIEKVFNLLEVHTMHLVGRDGFHLFRMDYSDEPYNQLFTAARS
ncbi:MAG: hypothetical protein ACSHXK_12585 [Oceanococcus sp.]